MNEPRSGRIPRVQCPACGAEMNPHAEKLMAPRTTSEEAAVDPALGGVVKEIHQCPACGAVESRTKST
jgi:hypothetical protein